MQENYVFGPALCGLNSKFIYLCGLNSKFIYLCGINSKFIYLWISALIRCINLIYYTSFEIPIDLRVTFFTIALRVTVEKNYHMRKTDARTVRSSRGLFNANDGSEPQ